MIDKYGLESSRFKSGSTGGVRRLGAALAAIGIAGAFAIGAAGCDTAAQISFPSRTFQEIHTSGFTAAGGSCEGVSNGEMKARFVLVDNDQFPIRLGDAVDRPSSGSSSVELSAESVSFTDGALMEVTAGACGTDGISTCSSSPVSFQCKSAPGVDGSMEGESLEACQITEDGMSVASSASGVRFVSNTDGDQVYGMLMENSGGLRGWSVTGTEGAFDVDGDGVIDTTEGDLPPEPLRYGEPIASDWNGKRFSAVTSAYTRWVKAYQLARETNRKTYFGLWSFNDIKTKPTSHIAEVSGPGVVWASESTPITGAISHYQNSSVGDRSGANVYEAATALINDSYSDEALSTLGIAQPQNAEKILVLFVDGYDDMRERIGSSLDKVVEAATENNVRIFIVHSDPALMEPEQIREDPKYWDGQTPCVDDSTCKNYESCRKPRGYAESGQTEVEKPEGFDETYCLPVHDEKGRVGPIDDYAQLACATEGGYAYSPSIESLVRNVGWTPYAMDGLWEVSVESATISRTPGLAGMPVKVHADMGVTVAGQSRNYAFSQVGESSGVSSDATVDAFDTRGVVFVGE